MCRPDAKRKEVMGPVIAPAWAYRAVFIRLKKIPGKEKEEGSFEFCVLNSIEPEGVSTANTSFYSSTPRVICAYMAYI